MVTIDISDKTLVDRVDKLVKFKNLKNRVELIKGLVENEEIKIRGERLDKLEFKFDQLAYSLADLGSRLKKLEDK